jgi:CDP-diacylglycerol--serine O-phosphatidyltransferase
MTILKLLKPPDLVTLASALLGFFAVLEAGVNHVTASVLILLAVVADGLDGFLARRLEHSSIGEHLDSLADLISFGVAPSVIVYVLLSGRIPFYVILPVLCFYLACGILRLARYGALSQTQKEDFNGLPITAGGMSIALFVIAGEILPLPLYLLPLMLLLALLMISSVEYPKLSNRKILMPMGFLTALSVLVYFVGMIIKAVQVYAFFIGVCLLFLMGVYLVSPLILRLKK